jgi:hypothetical protein
VTWPDITPVPSSAGATRAGEGIVAHDESYGSALCLSCRWKLEAYEGSDLRPRRTAASVTEAAREHAIGAGHQVSLVVTSHTTFDARVERGS